MTSVLADKVKLHPSPRDPDEGESQRFLMGLMNALISEFVLESNEVPEKYAADPEKPLNDHLRATAESCR